MTPFFKGMFPQVVDEEQAEQLMSEVEQPMAPVTITDPAKTIPNTTIAQVLAQNARQPAAEPMDESVEELESEEVEAVLPKQNRPAIEKLEAKKEASAEPVKSMFPNLSEIDLSRLKDAQESRRSGDRSALLARAGEQAITAMTKFRGGDYKGDDSLAKYFEQKGGRGVEELGEEQKFTSQEMKNISDKMDLGNEQQLNDPTSGISELYRQVAAKRGYQVPPNISAKQLEKMLPTIKSLAEREKKNYRFERVTGPDGSVRLMAFDAENPTSKIDLGQAGFAQDTRVDPRTGELITINKASGSARDLTTPGEVADQQPPADLTEGASVQPTPSAFQRLNVNQRKAVDTLQKQFATEAKDEISAIANVDGALELVNLAMTNPTALSSAKAQIARLFEKGVMTDADVERYTVNNGIANKFMDAANEMMSGTITADKARLLKETLQAVAKIKQKSLSARARQKASILTARGDVQATPDELAPLIYSSGGGAQKSPVKKQYSKSRNQTRVVYSDGSTEILEGKQ